jgi:hypothetical protein
LIRKIPENTCDLETHHKLMIYEGVGYMISEEKNPMQIELLLASLMQFVD